MTAAKAREELRIVILEAATVAYGGGSRVVLSGAAVDGILLAADRYRDAPPDEEDRRIAHLRGAPGWGSACRRRWQDPEALRLTGNPAAVTCVKCRRSLRYRALTGGDS